MPEDKKIAYYGRVSTEKQRGMSEDEQNENSQIDIVKKYLKEQGLELPEDQQYFDTVSAYKKPFEQRKDLQKLIKAARKKEVDTIVVSEADRISRQPKEHKILRELFKELGVDVILASDEKSYLEGSFFQQLLEDGMSKFEADNNATRTKSAMSYLQDQEKFTGGKVPYGYEVGDMEIKRMKNKEVNRISSFHPNGEKLDVVEKIYRRYATTESFSSIAKELKASRPKEKWSANKVKSIITNPIYIGYHGYGRLKSKSGGYTFKDLSEWKLKKCHFIETPAISKELWMFCWNKYIDNVEKSPRYLTTTFYFNGLLFCHCGLAMKGKDQRTHGGEHGHRWYICDKSKCNQKVDADNLHQCIESYYNSIWKTSEKLLDHMKDRIQAQLDDRITRLKEIEYEYLDLNRKINDLQQLKFDEEASKNAYLFEAKNSPVFLGYLMTNEALKKRSEELMFKKKREELFVKKYKECLNEKLLNKLIDPFMSRAFRDLSDSARRAFVLFFVKECKLIDQKSFNLTFYSLKEQMLTFT